MTTTPTAAYSIALQVELHNVPGVLGRLASSIGEAGGNIAHIGGFEAKGPSIVEEIYVNARDEQHAQRLAKVVADVEGVTLHGWYDRTFEMHEGGKIEVLPLCPVGDRDDLSMAYTPGVARVCMAIHDDPAMAHTHTIKKNTVAIVSNGTAVLGLGDIGPVAAMPVMEGKALLFKEFGGVDGFPICLDVETAEEVIERGGGHRAHVRWHQPRGHRRSRLLRHRGRASRLRSTSRCSTMTSTARQWSRWPRCATRCVLTGQAMGDLSVVIAGMGAAGVAIGKILINAGVGEIVGVDRAGAVHDGRDGLNYAKQWFAENTNPDAQGRHARPRSWSAPTCSSG